MARSGEKQAFNFFKHRMSRKEYWLFSGLLFAAGLLLAWFDPDSSGVSFGSVWLMIYAWRLHDFGRSGWWAVLVMACGVALALAGFLAAPDGAMYLFGADPDMPAPPASHLWTAGAFILGAVVLQFGFTVWLGLQPGDPGMNRYGWSDGKLPRTPTIFDAPQG